MEHLKITNPSTNIFKLIPEGLYTGKELSTIILFYITIGWKVDRILDHPLTSKHKEVQ